MTLPTTEYCSTNILDSRPEYSPRGAGFCASKKCVFIICSYWYAYCGPLLGRHSRNERRGAFWDEICTTVSPLPLPELGFTDSNEANITAETLCLIDQARSLTMAMAPRGDLCPYCSAEDCLVTFWRTISLDAFENEVPSIKVSADKENAFGNGCHPYLNRDNVGARKTVISKSPTVRPGLLKVSIWCSTRSAAVCLIHSHISKTVNPSASPIARKNHSHCPTQIASLLHFTLGRRGDKGGRVPGHWQGLRLAHHVWGSHADGDAE